MGSVVDVWPGAADYPSSQSTVILHNSLSDRACRFVLGWDCDKRLWKNLIVKILDLVDWTCSGSRVGRIGCYLHRGSAPAGPTSVIWNSTPKLSYSGVRQSAPRIRTLRQSDFVT